MQRYFMWLPVFTLFFIYQIILEQYLSSQMKVALSTFMREIVLRVLNITLIVLFGYGYIGFDLLVAGTVLVYLIPIIFLLIFSAQTKGFGFSFDFNVFTRQEYKEIIHFSWYHALLGISINLMGFLDALMIPLLDKNGLSSIAIYGNAVFIMSLLQIPYKAMSTATFPVLTIAFKNNNRAEVADIFKRSGINIFIASIGMALLIACNLNNAVMIMKNGYGPVVALVLIMMIGRLTDAATGMNDQTLSVSRYYKANFYMSIGLVIFMVIFNLILIPRYGIYGAAWSTSVALMLYNIAKCLYIWKKLDLQPFSINTLKTILIGIFVAILVQLIPYMVNPYLDTIIRSSIIIGIYVLLLFWLKPSPDISTYISSIRNNKRLF